MENHKSMTILSVGSQYKPNKGGNAKRSSTMSENFSKLGSKVIILTTTLTNSDFSDDEYSNNYGIKIHRFASIKKMLLNINRLISIYKPDILLCHNDITWLYCSIFTRNVIIINENHAIKKYINWKEFIKNSFYPIMRKRTKAVFVLSNNAKKIYVNKYKFNEKKIFFTPNGSDNDKNKSEINFSNSEKFVYMYGGTLYKWQGISVLLENIQEILSISKDVVVKIVGGGPMLGEVKEYVQKHNLNNRVIITGFLDQENYDKEVSMSDVILIPRPSTIETETAIPLKIFDAVKNNKPIVMSDVSGLTEVLTKNEALIYRNDKPIELVESCKQIYRNKDLAIKLINNANKKIENWPSDIEIAEKQLNIMSKLLKNKLS